MKRVVWSVMFWVAAGPAFAQDTTFNPAPKDVCVPAHAGGYVVDRKRLIARLVQVQAGVPAIDLRPDGQPVTFAMQVDALLRPEAFCTINGCAKPTVEKLRQAYFMLMEFLAANSGAGTKSFRLIGSNNPNDFLGAPEGTLDILCVTPPKQQKADDFGKPEVVKPRSFFAVRKNVEDLVYAQTDQQFKKLERANLSFKQDYEEDNASVGVDGVAGYTYGPAALGRSEIRLSPFISYKQDYVNKAGIASDKSRRRSKRRLAVSDRQDLSRPATLPEIRPFKSRWQCSARLSSRASCSISPMRPTTFTTPALFSRAV